MQLGNIPNNILIIKIIHETWDMSYHWDRERVCVDLRPLRILSPKFSKYK